MKRKIIIEITKDILLKTCIYFTFLTLILTAGGFILNVDTFAPKFCFMFILAALGAGIAVQIFKIEKFPMASRHIAFFILLYLDFLLIFIPLSEYTPNQNTTLYLSIIFIILYLVIFGIIMGIKSIVNSFRNKNLKYDKQFKEV
jgi:hypothetical protein